MDPFKIQNFERSHEGQSFPHAQALRPPDAEALRVRIAKAVGVEESLDGLSLTRRLDSMGTVVHGESPQRSSFDLRALVARLEITPHAHVYINWYRYDEIDRMRFDDLARYFTDVWYPSSDDIDLFDDSLSWILSVAHDGVVKLIRPMQVR
jgi:hypothetical protein